MKWKPCLKHEEIFFLNREGMNSIFYTRMALYIATPFLVIGFRSHEHILAGIMVLMFLALAWGRSWKTICSVALIGCGMAALEALCIHKGMWKYFHVSNIIPMWLPPLWATTVFFLWSIQPYLST